MLVSMAEWTLLTNHAHVLICIAREPGYRLREIADCVGLTERATHRLVDDLVKADYPPAPPHANRSFYEVPPDRPLRHDLVEHAEVGDILRPLLGPRTPATAEP